MSIVELLAPKIPPKWRNKHGFDPTGTNLYLDSLHYADHALGTFIEKLKQSPIGDNSLICIFGDHGFNYNKAKLNWLTTQSKKQYLLTLAKQNSTGLTPKARNNPCSHLLNKTKLNWFTPQSKEQYLLTLAKPN